MSRRRQLWQDAKAIAVPLVLYDLLVLVALTVFLGGALMLDPPDDVRAWMLLGTIIAASLAGTLAGQAAALLRLRSPVVLTLTMGALFATVTFGTGVAIQAQPLMLALVTGVMVGAIFVSGGFWSLRANRGLLAVWSPAVLFTSTILIVSETDGTTALWHAGQKYGVWSATTLLLLLVAILLSLAFLVARERHRLHRWRNAPVAVGWVEQRPDPFRPLAGIGTWVLLGALVLFLTVSTALLSPYLWRTGERPEGDRPIPHGTEPDDSDRRKRPSGDGMDTEALQRAIEQGIQATCALLTVLVLMLAALLVFGPPLRRQLLLTHLRDPAWPVPPSRQAMLHWRLVEIALADAGIVRAPSETALDVAQRAIQAMPDVNLDGLASAAQIVDRVSYGYALEPGDADLMQRAAEMAYHAIWETLGELDRLRAVYRWV